MAVKGTALILTALCIIIFAAQHFIPMLTEFLVLNPLAWSQPWRFITAIFAHGSLVHLLYNAFALALFGTLLENLQSPRKFLFIFLSTGILANLFAVMLYPSSLGASGAIFGVIGALTVIRPMLVVWTFGIPMPLFLASALWALGDLIGIFVPTNVANIAHLAGLAVGIVLGSLYRSSYDAPQHSHSSRIALDEHAMRRWEDRHLKG